VLAITFNPITSKPTQAKPNQKLLVCNASPQILLALPSKAPRCILFSMVLDCNLATWATGAGGTVFRSV